MKRKQLHQVKTRWYYVFWGIMAFAVVSGQLYVGTGYRIMAQSFNRLMDAAVAELSSGGGEWQ